VPGCCLLDIHSDRDHNRSVFTFAGSPAAVEEAAMGLATAAVELVDLRRHEGTHPRIGALDVLPFVPLAGSDLAHCVALAERVGRRLADELALPVYLYALAARPGRPVTLAELRHADLEALPPDHGGRWPHLTAGAVAVGAREPLVAFNLMLETPDVGIARRVARAVRAASGGPAALQALGMYLPSRGRAQVSMNLLDHRQTSILAAVAAVSNAAAAEGTKVTEAELVGLAPAAALAGLETEHLPGLPGPGRSIEARLETCAR
jgi:glutamate formiminotransferase